MFLHELFKEESFSMDLWKQHHTRIYQMKCLTKLRHIFKSPPW